MNKKKPKWNNKVIRKILKKITKLKSEIKFISYTPYKNWDW